MGAAALLDPGIGRGWPRSNGCWACIVISTVVSPSNPTFPPSTKMPFYIISLLSIEVIGAKPRARRCSMIHWPEAKWRKSAIIVKAETATKPDFT